MDPRTVLVTGGNSRIGLATLLEVAGRGFRALGTVRSPAKARSIKEAARARGLEVSTPCWT
jgi:NAD(P)-dependent dehydrogenase (short-subunit alcohol dehydrogenase family)